MNKRKALYDYIKGYIDENGYAPSIREMRDGVGMSSTSVVEHHLKGLSDAGLIKKDDNRARAIVILNDNKS